MTLLHTNPFERLLGLQRDLDRALGAPLLGFEGTRTVFPPVNVFEDRDGIVIRAEVPGFAPDEIDLSIEPRTLVLKGRRDADEPAGQGSFHRRERQHGSFARSLSLPKGLDADKATAECSHGLLTIRIPKAEAAKPKAIQIKTAA